MKKEAILYDMMWYIQNKKEFTAQELGNEFQLSVRSVYRYISDLADLGVYVESKKGRNGGFTVLPNQVLPPILFTESELISVYFAIQSLSDYNDFPFKLNTVTAAEKLLGVVSKKLREKLLHLSSHFEVSTPKQAVSNPFLNTLITAALDYQVIQILYQSTKKRSKKQLEPIGIYGNNGFWYLYALDRALEKTRHYRIDRIQELITIDEHFAPTQKLEQINENYQPQQPVRLVAELTEKGAKQCLENRYLYNGVQEKKKGVIELSILIDSSDVPYTAEFFLLLGKEGKVKEPKCMVDMLKQKSKELLTVYAD